MNIRQHTKNIAHKIKIRTIWPYVVILVTGVIICYPSLHMGVSFGDDLPFHAYRYHSVIDGLKDHQLLPQLDPWAANGFGHSWNLFYGPLSAYAVTLLRFMIPSWAVAVNAFIVLAVIASGILMYRFVSEVSKRKLIGLLAAILFMCAPYHLTDIYVRQAQGELLAFAFIPLVFHGLHRLIHGTGGKLLTVAGITGLLLSHNLSTIMVLFFAVLYVLLNFRLVLPQLKTFVKDIAIAFIFVFGLTSFFTLPMLEAKATGVYNIFDTSYAATYMGMSSEHLESWSLRPSQLFFNHNPVHPTLAIMPFALGGVTIVTVLLFVTVLRRIPKDQKHFVFTMFGLGLFALFLTTTLVPWAFLPHAALAIQFPWRFLMLFNFFIAIAGAYGLYYSCLFMAKKTHAKDWTLYLMVPLLIATCIASSSDILRFGQQHSRWDGTFTYSEAAGAPVFGTGGDEYAPRNTTSSVRRLEDRLPIYLEKYGHQPAVVRGEAVISGYSRDGSRASFHIVGKGNETINVIMPYLYYPGYKASLTRENGTTENLSTSFSNDGFLVVIVKADQTGTIRTHFGTSRATALGLGITGLTTLVGCTLLLRRHTKVTRP